jgi:hypothetical protein
MNIVLIGQIGNPLCANWAYGLKDLSHNVLAVSWARQPLSPALLVQYGFGGDIPVVHSWTGLEDSLQKSVEAHFAGAPDLIFGWWGNTAISPLKTGKRLFPQAQTILCVNCYPDTSMWITEIREVLQYHAAVRSIDGYIYYSEAMRNQFCARVQAAGKRPALVMLEPFPLRTYLGANINSLNGYTLTRNDDSPYVIFTGRGDLLWTKDVRYRKDAIGPFLADLANSGVHVYVSSKADTRGINNLHTYPHFTNEELFRGTFSAYVSQFDAHLVLYNEHNGTIRRRVATGLSTRYAFAVTADCPIAVTHTSAFVREFQKRAPFHLCFHDTSDLIAQLRDHGLLQQLRNNLAAVKRTFALENNAERLAAFLTNVRQGVDG